MKAVLNVYKSNKELIDNFICTTIGRLNIQKLDNDCSETIFSTIDASLLAYSVNNDHLVNSLYYYKNKTDDSKIGMDKKYYFAKADFSNSKEYLSKPYISSNTGKINITYATQIDDGYLVVDLDMVLILEKLKLIQSNKIARNINNFVYGFMGFSLLILAVSLGFFAVGTFFQSILTVGFDIENTFQSIIALTLGLAIFDLAKTILEQEIFFKNISYGESGENRILSKFLISIIIALSIEALMVVFKIALKDYTNMIHGFLLILGVSFMIYAVGKYNYFIKK